MAAASPSSPAPVSPSASPSYTCAQCSKTSDSLLKCKGCKRAYYCDVACQTEHWKAGHNVECKKAAKRAEDEATGSSVDAAESKGEQSVQGGVQPGEEVHDLTQEEEKEEKEPSVDDVVSSLREEAAEATRRGDHEEAYGKFTQALALKQDEAKLYEGRANACLMTGRMDQALRDARRAVELDPKGLRARIRLLRILLKRGSLTEAIALGEALLEEEPTNNAVINDLKTARVCKLRMDAAEIAMSAKRMDEASALAAKVLQDAPGSIEATMIRAEVLVEKGLFDEAYSMTKFVLESAVESGNTSDSTKILFLRARIFFAQERFDQCVKHLQELLRGDPDHTPSAKLLKAVRKIQRLKTEGDEAFGRGEFEAADQAYASSLEEMDKVAPIPPPIVIESEDSSNSSSTVTQPAAVPLKALRAKVHCNRAAALCSLSNYGQAVGECDKAIEYDPTYLKAYTRRITCNRALGGKDRLERVVFDYEKIEQLQPEPTRESRENIRQAKLALKQAKRKDYYALLGITSGREAHTQEDIKKAYKRAAIKWHPDRHTNSTPEVKAEAENVFKDVQEAIGVLGDENKRRMYDQGLDLEEIEARAGQPGQHQFPQHHGNSHGRSPFSGGGFHGGFGGGGFGGGGFGGGGFGGGDDDADMFRQFFQQQQYGRNR